MSATSRTTVHRVGLALLLALILAPADASAQSMPGFRMPGPATPVGTATHGFTGLPAAGGIGLAQG